MDHPVAPPGAVASREHPLTGLNPQTPPATQAQFWQALRDKLRNWASWPRNAPRAATDPQTTSHNTIDPDFRDLERQALIPEVQWEITPLSVLISTLHYAYLICHLFIPAIYRGRIQHIFDESGHTIDRIVAIFHANHQPVPNTRTTVIESPQTVERGGPGRSSNSAGERGREGREQSDSSDDSPGGGGDGGPDGRGGDGGEGDNGGEGGRGGGVGGEKGEEEEAGGQGGAEKAQVVERWNDMVDQFVEEWKTMSIISALLVPGGFTWFSIVNAANDPVVRGLAFISIMLAFWSLICCCFYIIQLRRMKNDGIIAKVALEIQNSSPAWWNACFMLALPAVWLLWSIIIFLAAIFVFMWRARASLPDGFSPNTPPHTEFAFRILACVTSGLALVSFVAAVMTSYKYIRRARPRRTRPA